MSNYKCTNAFKENGKTYLYGHEIGEGEYNRISKLNKKWFEKIIEKILPPDDNYDPFGVVNIGIASMLNNTPDSSTSFDFGSSNDSSSPSSDFGGFDGGSGGGAGAAGDWVVITNTI